MKITNKLRPKPSPFKAILKSYNVPISHIAPFLGFTYPYTVNLINGVEKMTPAVAEKLQALVDELEVEAANGN